MTAARQGGRGGGWLWRLAGRNRGVAGGGGWLGEAGPAVGGGGWARVAGRLAWGGRAAAGRWRRLSRRGGAAAGGCGFSFGVVRLLAGAAGRGRSARFLTGEAARRRRRLPVRGGWLPAGGQRSAVVSRRLVIGGEATAAGGSLLGGAACLLARAAGSGRLNFAHKEAIGKALTSALLHVLPEAAACRTMR